MKTKTKSVTFLLDREVNAFYDSGRKHLHLAAGSYTTEDREIQAFLSAGYPGVTVQDVKPIVAPPPLQPGQYGPRPEPTRVIHGFSGGGAMNAKQKAAKSTDVST